MNIALGCVIPVNDADPTGLRGANEGRGRIIIRVGDSNAGSRGGRRLGMTKAIIIVRLTLARDWMDGCEEGG